MGENKAETEESSLNYRAIGKSLAWTSSTLLLFGPYASLLRDESTRKKAAIPLVGVAGLLLLNEWSSRNTRRIRMQALSEKPLRTISERKDASCQTDDMVVPQESLEFRDEGCQTVMLDCPDSPESATVRISPSMSSIPSTPDSASGKISEKRDGSCQTDTFSCPGTPETAIIKFSMPKDESCQTTQMTCPETPQSSKRCQVTTISCPESPDLGSVSDSSVSTASSFMDAFALMTTSHCKRVLLKERQKSEEVDFFLPRLNAWCHCARCSRVFAIFDQPETLPLPTILRPWQANFLKDHHLITVGDLMLLSHRKAKEIVKDMPEWREKNGMTAHKRKGCYVAFHIWARAAANIVTEARADKMDHDHRAATNVVTEVRGAKKAAGDHDISEITFSPDIVDRVKRSYR